MFSLRKTVLAGLTLVGAALLPGMALAADNGFTTGNVNLRGGPNTYYPVITTVPYGAPVEIFGCAERLSWCDVAWQGYRGWMSSRYLEYFFENQRYDLPTYSAHYNVPIITFDHGYWDQHYASLPFYGDWERYWNYTPPRRYVAPRHYEAPRQYERVQRYTPAPRYNANRY